MSNNAHRFRQTEVRRAIKSFCAATGTAHSDIRVEIDRDGTISVFARPQAEKPTNSNEWILPDEPNTAVHP